MRKLFVERKGEQWRAFYLDGANKRNYLRYDFTKTMEHIKAYARLHGYHIQLSRRLKG